VGDDVIREVSRALRSQLRDLDIAGRYGGEEFGVILTGTTAEGAAVFAERLRNTIENLVVHSEGQEVKFTISLGINQLDESTPDHRAWIEKADQALYQSKEGGRNRYTIF
jgi:diguanylate cyclase